MGQRPHAGRAPAIREPAPRKNIEAAIGEMGKLALR